MQTPRGFLIGAGVIAAIAALTSVGHPHTETAVETTAPIVTDAIEDTTTTRPRRRSLRLAALRSTSRLASMQAHTQRLQARRV